MFRYFRMFPENTGLSLPQSTSLTAPSSEGAKGWVSKICIVRGGQGVGVQNLHRQRGPRGGCLKSASSEGKPLLQKRSRECGSQSHFINLSMACVRSLMASISPAVTASTMQCFMWSFKITLPVLSSAERTAAS